MRETKDKSIGQEVKIVDVTPENISQETVFCIKDISSEGFRCKQEWYLDRYREGLRLSIMKNVEGKMIGFIEFVPADMAWRPVMAKDFVLIHCMYIYPNKYKNLGLGSQLIEYVEDRARILDMAGVCVVTSKGTWMAGKQVFEKNGYRQVDSKDRFDLLSKKWKKNARDPVFIDWSVKQPSYQGWHLLYADQCPWHDKAVKALLKTADEYGLKLQVTKLDTAKETKNAPSGYGVFSLLHNGKLLEDHYISATRFRNIIKKELHL